MSHDEEPDWTAEERAKLAAWPLEVPPPPRLEDRVLAQLGSRRSGRPARRLGFRALGSLAAALAVFVGGWWTGARRPAQSWPAAPAGERYLLLLREDASFDRGGSPAERVAEYRDWAAGLRRQGRLELGEELAGEGVLLPDGSAAPADGGPGKVAGFFVIRAETPAQAASIADSCPHLRHGGRVELRRIVDT